jgi:hypothetical protein
VFAASRCGELSFGPKWLSKKYLSADHVHLLGPTQAHINKCKKSTPVTAKAVE